MYDLYGKQVQRITILNQITNVRPQQPHDLAFYDKKFYIFMKKKILVGESNVCGILKVRNIFPLDGTLHDAVIDSEEMYYRVLGQERKNEIIVASTATGRKTRTITLPVKRLSNFLSGLYLSDHGLFVSDWYDHAVYLFQ